MKIRNNCTIDKILSRIEQGESNVELQFLMERINDYKKSTEKQVGFYLDKYYDDYPDVKDTKHFMVWVEKNVPVKYKGYVRKKYLRTSYDVLKKNIARYKTIEEIGITTDQSNNMLRDDYLSQWKDIAEEMSQYPLFFETHAHYNLSHFDKSRSELLKMMQKAGVARCIIPSIEAYKGVKNVNFQIKEMFDHSNWIYYAFASHPKYLWKDKDWDADKWKAFDKLLSDPKCVAVGETGLDYSYKEFSPEHLRLQKDFFIRFVELANKHKLPVILHVRSGIYKETDKFIPDVNHDALEILLDHPIHNGAVLHCFGGDESLMWDYYKHGVKYFGIGGRILNGEEHLEAAVKEMPEESLLLETDSPYINSIEGISGPNTSLALLPIAKKIADLRKMDVRDLIELAYQNAERLFGV